MAEMDLIIVLTSTIGAWKSRCAIVSGVRNLRQPSERPSDASSAVFQDELDNAHAFCGTPLTV